jgi:hypothetical protein
MMLRVPGQDYPPLMTDLRDPYFVFLIVPKVLMMKLVASALCPQRFCDVFASQ